MAYSNPKPEILDNLVDTNTNNQEFVDYTKMKEVYFAFIDVLGFKKTFDDMKLTRNTKEVENFKDVFNYYFDIMNAAKFFDKKNSDACYAGQTSDSLYFYTERSDYLVEFIKIFAHFSLYAMSRNVFFRGGISKGMLYKKADYQFFGDSVIGAYLIESNISKDPIIVIDAKTHHDICKYTDYERLVDGTKNRNFIKPFEYLQGDILLDLIEDFSIREIDKKRIEKNINRNVQKFEFDDRNYSKYLFLKNEYQKYKEKRVRGK